VTVRVVELLAPDFNRRLVRPRLAATFFEDDVTARLTVPENPAILPRLIVDVPVALGLRTRVTGLALMLKDATYSTA
jgi:hypothetical protein